MLVFDPVIEALGELVAVVRSAGSRYENNLSLFHVCRKAHKPRSIRLRSAISHQKES